MKELSVVIVTYNSEEYIKKCLESVFDKLPKGTQVIVVDNASNDKTVDIIEENFSKVNLIIQSVNLGFSKANNLGAKVADGEYLVFLNPDSQILEMNFSEVKNVFENDKNIGLIAPKLIRQDGSTQPSVTTLPTLSGAIARYWFGQKSAYGEYVPSSSEPIGVEAIYAACWIMKRDIFKKMGGFNEKYFLYFEDIDFCRKLKTHGLKILYYPRAVVKHFMGASGKTNPKTALLHKQSSALYHGVAKSLLLYAILRFRPIK